MAEHGAVIPNTLNGKVWVDDRKKGPARKPTKGSTSIRKATPPSGFTS